jgi:Na+-transporting methylmalonyl-CoA/oxaloacetate decarboxylase gamma subunit
MKHFLFFLVVSVVAVGSWAQASIGRDNAAKDAAKEAALEQRRADLRQALKALRAQEAQGKDQMFENVSADRHLSTQERADLRQQLRQQRRDVNPGPP